MVIASGCVILVVVWTLLAYVLVPLPLEDAFFAWVRRQWLLEGAAAGTCLGVLALLSTRRGRAAARWPGWWWAWAAWIAWAAASAAYSIDPGATLRSLLAFTSYGLLAYLVSRLVTNERDLSLWVRFVVVVAVVVSLEGLFQYVWTFASTLRVMDQLQASGRLTIEGWGEGVIKDFLVRKRIFSVFGWPNLYAGFLLLAIPCAIALSVQSRRWLPRLAWALAASALIISLLLTLSLGGWIAAILTSSVAWWLMRRRQMAKSGRPGPRRLRLASVVLAGLGLSVVLFITSLMVAKRAQSFILSSLRSRVVYAQGAWRILRTHPVRGTGMGTFALSYQAVKPLEREEGQHNAIHAHNTFLEIGSELGLVGLGLFALFLLRVGWLVVGARSRDQADRAAILRQGVAIGLVGFFLHSLLEQTFVESVTAPFWWMALGLLTGASTVEPSGTLPDARAPIHRAGWLLSLGAGILGCLLAVRLAIADAWAARGAFLDGAGNIAASADAFARAARWDPLAHRYPLELGNRLLREAQRRSPEEAQILRAEALRHYERAARLSPWLGFAWMRLGQTAWGLGQVDRAVGALRQGVARDPNSREALLTLGKMLRATGQDDELRRISGRLRQLEPSEPQGWLFEALAWQHQGEWERAERAYLALLERTPTYYPAWFNLGESRYRRGDLRGAAMAYHRFLEAAPATETSPRGVAERQLELLRDEDKDHAH